MAPTFVDESRAPASRYPDVLVCDLETLRDAPSHDVAGVGDLWPRLEAMQNGGWRTVWEWTRFYCVCTKPHGPLDEIFWEAIQ